MNRLKIVMVLLVIGSFLTTVTAYGVSNEIVVRGQVGGSEQVETPIPSEALVEQEALAKPKESIVQENLPRMGLRTRIAWSWFGGGWLILCLIIVSRRWSNHQENK